MKYRTPGDIEAMSDGYVLGLMAYAEAKGESCLKSDNPLMRRLMEERHEKIELLLSLDEDAGATAQPSVNSESRKLIPGVDFEQSTFR